MKNLVVVLVIAFAFSTIATASDIAFYVGQFNTDGWYGEEQFTDVETIIAETGHLFNDIQQFNDDDLTFAAFNAWVEANTNDGEMDIIWLNGCTPSGLYPNPNELPDGSRIEAWLDGGNMVINVGDWFAYATYEGGPRGGEGRGGDNGGDGAANILDLSSGIIVGADGTMLTVTATGQEYLPSLGGATVKTDRPVVLSAVQAPWEVAAIFASSGGTEDPAAEAQGDPIVIHNTETGGYVAFVNQASGGPDGWIGDRGLTCAEFIGNWVSEVVGLSPVIEKTVLFAEDFEGLTLGPNVDEALAGEQVWTDTPPEGWSVDDSGIPGINLDATDGVTEWAGWAFTDKAWWIQAAEDQDRSLFDLGSGTVAVADPDEWDDAERLPIPISADPYDTWLTTPEIKIADAEAGTLELKFDSSWRPEFDDNYHQTANITASFDGGDPVEVMLWESDEASPNYHPYATNETVIVKLDKPEGAKKVVLTFGLFDAGNDWWWAIDNIEVRGVVPDLEPVNPGTDGLVAFYALDGDATDSSGNGNDGTIVGDPVFVEGPTGFGSALQFDGVDDYVDCGNAEVLDIREELTLMCWIKVAAFSKTWETILSKGDDSYRMSRGPGTGDSIHFGANGTGDNLNANTIVTTDTWRHVALVFNGTEKIIYIDGAEDVRADASGTINSSGYNFYIGQNSQQANRFLTGIVDEVMIYNRALSEAEIRYLAGQRATPVDPGTDGLVAYYEFENNADDSSGNEIHGTLVGDAGFADGPEGYGMALSLDGDGDYVDCGLNPLLDITEEITFTYWIKVVALDRGWNTVLSRGDDSWRSSRAGENNFMEAAVGGTSGNYLYAVTPVDDDKWHHFGAVYDGDTFTLYLDGEKESSEESTGLITASTYPLLIGENAQATGRFWNGLIDEVVIYDRALSTGEIRYLAGKRLMDDLLGPDVTGPGDVVKGVPDEARDGTIAGWPNNEHPALALDDNVSTKFLHFRGEVSPTGFVVEPALGASIVTGLTFTTANDATERDPISFELSGSNDSIDGPYTLIASGDIEDFAQEEAWPRFTMNATPITFDNNVAYKYYQVMFPAVRNPGSANSMQIAEIELRTSKY